MKRPRPISLVTLLCVLWALPAMAEPHALNWQHDLEAAKATAKQTGRLVLVHFWMPECAPCVMLDQNVFSQPGVAGAIEAQFVPVKLNANENPGTAQGLGITRVPTDVIITPDGQIVGKLISPPTPSAYIAEITQTANRYASRFGSAFADAAARATSPPQLNAAYAKLPVNPAAPPAVLAGLATSPSMPQINAVGGGMPPVARPVTNSTWPTAAATNQYQSPTNQYQSSFATSQIVPPATPGSTNMFGTPPAPGGVGVSVATAPVATAPVMQAPPAIVDNRYAQAPTNEVLNSPVASAGAPSIPPAAPLLPQQTSIPSTGPTSAAPTAPAASQAAAEPLSAAPRFEQPAASPSGEAMLPAGSPPLGFDGFCTVSMRTHWQWAPGNPQWGAVHRGRTYLFAGQAEQQQFLQNPDYYAPALSGVDPVLAVEHRQVVPGRREHSIDYDNQIYLFASEATLEQFSANPERYAASVRQAMGIDRGQLVR
jgi:YHS domain-containing protein/thiol-disulfide isomerase/thioredoxin